MNDKVNIIFVLPDGLTLGGVTTWSVEMCRRLSEMDKPVALVEDSAYYGPKLDIDLPSEVHVVNCASLAHPPTERHLAGHIPAYRSALPGLFIPNWSFGTYAACTAIATDTPAALRVIGFAHTDETDYYQWLVHYEPIIHLFVAVSQEIAAALTRLLLHRFGRDYITFRPQGIRLSADSRGYGINGLYRPHRGVPTHS